MSFRPFSPFRPGNSTDQQLGIQSTPSDLAAAATLNTPGTDSRGTEEAVDATAAGAQFTDRGIEIADGTVSRVQLGDISANKDGSSFGLKVISSDGSTVIVDGTSDMFRIAASGSHSKATVTGNVLVTQNTQFPGLGAQSAVPAHLSYLGVSGASSGDHFLTYRSLTRGWVAGSSGGSPTNPALTDTIAAEGSTYLDGSNLVNFITWITNANAGAVTVFAKFYILAQAAI